MAANPLGFLKRRLSAALAWRVRDAIEAERTATVELGKTFVDATVELTERIARLEAKVAELENRN